MPSLLLAYLMAIVCCTLSLRVKPDGREGLCHGWCKGLSVFLIHRKVLASQGPSRSLRKSINQDYSAYSREAQEILCQQVSPLLGMSHQLLLWPSTSSGLGQS